jgi:hypothetical protein
VLEACDAPRRIRCRAVLAGLGWALAFLAAVCVHAASKLRDERSVYKKRLVPLDKRVGTI